MNISNVITPFIKFGFQTTKSQSKGFDGFVYVFSADKFNKFKTSVQTIVETHAHSANRRQFWIRLKNQCISWVFLGQSGFYLRTRYRIQNLRVGFLLNQCTDG